VILPFLFKNLRNFLKRVFYRYFLRDLNLGSLELLVGAALLAFGLIFGVTSWVGAVSEGVTASAGTVMLAGLPILAGLQMVLGFFAFDVAAVPKTPLQLILGRAAPEKEPA
jgi:dolichol-phosphate mannosyltransferase